MAELPEGAEREHGGLIPGTRQSAFSLTTQKDMPIPVIIAVPHAGRSYSQALLGQMRDADYSKIRLEDRFVDRIAADACTATGASLLVADAPRAVLDLNRATDDVDWDMIANLPAGQARHSAANRRARSGLGLIPRRLPGLGEIWQRRLSEGELAARIRQIHVPYHAALASTLQKIRDRWGAALLLDLHSMPPLKKAHKDDVPAHFVLGDRFGASASDRLVACALRHFAESGASVSHNRPYAGGYVLDRHAAPAHGIHAVQLEICRSQYLDPEWSETTDEIHRLVPLIAGLVRTLGEETARIARDSGLPIAAE